MRLDVTNIGTDFVSGHASRPGLSSIALAVPLAGIFGSETLVYSGMIETALWGHFLTLLYCTLAPLRFENETPVFTAFGLVPLFRLVNLGVPVFIELTLLWLPLVYGPLLPGLYLIANRQSPVRFTVGKLVQLVAWFPLAVALSLVLATIEYRIVEPAALIPAWNALGVVTLGLVMVGFVALAEELLFRGVLQRTLVDRFGTAPGIALAAIVFGAMHTGFGEPTEIGFAVATGIILGVIYAKSDNLGLVTVIHGSLNVFLYGLFPVQGLLLSV